MVTRFRISLWPFSKVGLLLLVFTIIFSVVVISPKHSHAATIHTWNKFNAVDDSTWSGKLKKQMYGNYGSGKAFQESAYDIPTSDYTFRGTFSDLMSSFGHGYSKATASGKDFILTDSYSFNNPYPDFSTVYSKKGSRYYRTDFSYNGFNVTGSITVYQMVTETPKVKGTVVQSGVTAPAGTYPVDGLHTDGFWYVYTGSVANSVPVLNITSTGDTAIYNDGGSFSISGNVQDGNNENIIVSATIGGVTKSVTVSGTSVAKGWVLTWGGTEVPVGTYANPVVSANDGEAISKVNYSGRFTVNAQIYYYWSEFSVVNEAGWYIDDNPQNAATVYVKSIDGVYKSDDSYRFNQLENLMNSSNMEWFVTSVSGESIRFGNSTNGNTQSYKYPDTKGYTYKGTVYDYVRFYRFNGAGSDRVISVSEVKAQAPKQKGTLIQSNIKAVQNTYPDNGIHSDGFWYVKSGSVPNNIPSITVSAVSGIQYSNNGSISLSGTVSDADNDVIAVTVEIGGVVRTVAVSNTSSAKQYTLNVTGLLEGTYEGFSIRADDGKGGVATIVFNGKFVVDRTPPSQAIIRIGN